MKAIVRSVVWLALGAVLSGAAYLTVLYDHTGREAVDRIGVRLGLRPAAQDGAYSTLEFLSRRDFAGVRSPSSPGWKVRRGLDLEKVVTGFTYPVNMAFKQTSSTQDNEPWFYVTELHGDVKYVTRGGKIGTFAHGLLNYAPQTNFGSDESGLTGLCTIPGSEDLLVTAAFLSEETGLLQNHLLRLHSKSGGRELASVEAILEMPEFTASAHQIQQVVIGPDQKLYVAVGDGRNSSFSLDLEKFGGKILRMNPDGTPCEDNPFFRRGAPVSPSSYVYAMGVRNVFDFDFDPASGRCYAMDNGRSIDRFFQVLPGGCYGWDGYNDSTRVNALYEWGPLNNVGPAGLVILRTPVMGKDTAGRAYGAMCGKPSEGLDAKGCGKSLWEFVLEEKTGLLRREPEMILQYIGSAKATVVGLCEGADGLYFTDFFGDSHGTGNDMAQGSIWRIVASETTLTLPDADAESLAKLTAEQRGQRLFARHCATCHRVNGFGGFEGPELTRACSNLQSRLGSRGYQAKVEQLLASQAEFVVEQQPKLREVMQTKGESRVRTWLRHHLAEPRFDNTFARMPSFAETVTPEERNDLIEYVMTCR